MLRAGGSGTSPRAAEAPEKSSFERAFAAYVGRRHAIAVSSGTTALDLAFDALALEPGGIVVAPSYGHPSAIRRAAERHALCLLDVTDDSLCLSPRALADALAERDVRCVVTIDFAGQPAGNDEIERLCQQAGIPLIEDASHAHGAMLRGRAAGSFGTIGAFSLHASKNVPVGEGGIVCVDDDELFAKLWRAHDLGRHRGGGPYDFAELGGAHRIHPIAALVGSHRLADLPQQLRTRRQAAAALRAALPKHGPLALLAEADGVDAHAYHLVAARYRPEACGGVSRRRFVLALAAEGIPCSIGWPALLSALPGLHLAKAQPPTPIADGAVTESVWLDARLLLEQNGVRQIADAVAKIADRAAELGGRR
jgi:dTDP-4-amino-4,6-dideoxygalactose transaminase